MDPGAPAGGPEEGFGRVHMSCPGQDRTDGRKPVTVLDDDGSQGMAAWHALCSSCLTKEQPNVGYMLSVGYSSTRAV